MESSNPDHVLARLDAALRGVRKRLDLDGPSVPGLRPSHFRLLDFTPSTSIRLSDLAQRANMTKQAAGEFVATLQAAGLLQIEPDHVDRRARLIRLTANGRRVQRQIRDVITTAERDVQQRVGPAKWAAFCEVIEVMGSLTQPRADRS